MNASVVCYAASLAVFVLWGLGVTVGHVTPLPWGLALLTAGHLVR